jgi:general secretion pathway protein A
MYAHFYHLSESPFNLTPDPKFQYVNESTREAMASLLHGIRGRKGFITLIAEAGTGKTTMLKRIVDEIEGETRVVFVFNPGVSFDELLEFICMELGIRTDSTKRLHLIERLNAFLLEQLTEGRNVVVMIDEAQTLEESVLEELRLLSNLETAKEKILQIVLSGQPELEDKLRKPQLRQLRQRIGVRCTLKPMQANEIAAYVETRLRSAGADRADFFTPVGLRKIWQASKGIPRVINAICDNAMMIAFAEGKHRIDSAVINEAVRDLHGADVGSDYRSIASEWIAHPAARYVAAAALALAFLIPTAGNLMDAWRNLDDDVVAQASPVDRDRGPRPVVGSSPQAVPAPAVEDVAVRGDAPGREPAEPLLATAAQPRRNPDAVEAAPDRPHVATSSDPIVAAGRAAVDPETATVHGNAVLESIRRAEVLARSTAARIYDGRRRSLEESARSQANSAGLGKVPSRPVPEPEESLVEIVGGREVVGEDEVDELDELVESGGGDSMPAELNEDAAMGADDEINGDVKAPLGGDDDEAVVVASSGKNVEKVDSAADDRAEASIVADARVAEKTEDARELSEAVEKLATAASNLAVAVEEGTVSEEPVVESPLSRLAAQEASIETLGPDSGGLVVGRHVRVQPGETIWDLAIGYYGTAGESTLTRILNSNPGIRDPRRLIVGAHVYLPFQRAERMVHADSDDTYRVLLAVSPKRSLLEETRSWIKGLGENVQLGTATVEDTGTLYHLYAIGIRNKRDAVALAERVLSSRENRAIVAGRIDLAAF